MARQITKAGIAVTLLAMALHAGTAGAHGKVTMEEDSCMRRVGENMIHLSTYQPQWMRMVITARIYLMQGARYLS